MKINRTPEDGVYLTDEQVDIIEAINIKKENILIASISGAGKSSTLLYAVKDRTSKAKNVLFIAFNKKISNEIKAKNIPNMDVSTVHALAYKYVVAPLNLKITNNLSFNDIFVNYSQKMPFIRLFNEYCKSDIVRVDDFFKNKIFAKEAKRIMQYTLNGRMQITHDIYLKWFQIMLKYKDIKPKEYDLLLSDECITGDTTVELDNGKQVRIKTIVNRLKKGEDIFVKSFNEKTKAFEIKRALNPLISENRKIVRIITCNGTEIKCTPNHKILTIDGYKRADELKYGNKLLRTSAGSIFYELVAKIEDYGVDTVYDFEVEDNHNFLIGYGESKTVVHNCHDFNECMTDILLNYPAKQKVGVADNNQRINGFMGSDKAVFTILKNGFKQYFLSNTMRCSPALANNVEIFCRANLDKNFRFVGKNTSDPEFNTFAYLVRANVELISIIAELQKYNITFETTRPVDTIFHLFLMIKFNAKNEYEYYKKHKKNSKKFKKEDIKYVREYSNYIKDLNIMNKNIEGKISDVEAFREYSYGFDPKNKKYPNMNFTTWLSLQDELVYEFEELIRTAKTIINLSNKKIDIYSVYKYAKELEKNKTKSCLLISTAHSFKGGTVDISYLSNGLNSAIQKEWNRNIKFCENNKFNPIDLDPADDNNRLENEITNLYYVAFTRSKYYTGNAEMIKYRWYDNKQIQNTYEGENINLTKFLSLVKERQNGNSSFKLF